MDTLVWAAMYCCIVHVLCCAEGETIAVLASRSLP